MKVKIYFIRKIFYIKQMLLVTSLLVMSQARKIFWKVMKFKRAVSNVPRMTNSQELIDAWRIYGPKLCELIFGSSMVAVPSLEDAFSFDLLACFSKNKSNLFKNSFSLLGHILNIIKRGSSVTNMSDILKISTISSLGCGGLSNTWKSDNKSVTIRMEGLSKRWINHDLTLFAIDCDKVDLRGKKLYIITEVICAEMVWIDVEINSSRITQEYEDFPVAYSYLKFTVDADGGIISSDKMTKLKVNAVFEGI